MFVLTPFGSALLIAAMVIAAVLITAAAWKPIHHIKWICEALDLEPLKGEEDKHEAGNRQERSLAGSNQSEGIHPRKAI